ncbi:gamma-glutamylcyclotransferase family protein [Dyadobacter aurulentus]|uniref:gamma-glutamylcyclotransferase family protein n=1 Tax=Dyadobacter sp. UC 10 TaxID=2605428 RepID=UPI0011F3AA77|nr:gamma-glutamylcyclotransferase family protein [Dyadobacter sp. UC 10]KAA0992971.1 gamma-glutamylcyclotransferase [Dyadobacter sp. UC 10]
MQTFVFGYGSLINLKSLSRTMQTEMSVHDIIPVRLNGFSRVWNLREPIFSAGLQKRIEGIFLNIRPESDKWVNGVIFEVSPSQLEYLNEREKNYSRLNVSAQIEPYFGHQWKENETFVYIADNPEFLLDEPTEDSYVMNRYIEIVETGCAGIGDFFLEDYRKTTSANPFKLLSGDYSFDFR